MSALAVLSAVSLASIAAPEPCHVVTPRAILRCDASPEELRAAAAPPPAKPGPRVDAPRDVPPPSEAARGSAAGPTEAGPGAAPAPEPEPEPERPDAGQDPRSTPAEAARARAEEERAAAEEERARAEAERQAMLAELAAIREELGATRARVEREEAERRWREDQLGRTAAELRQTLAVLATGSVTDVAPSLERAARTFEATGQPRPAAAIAAARAAIDRRNFVQARAAIGQAVLAAEQGATAR